MNQKKNILIAAICALSILSILAGGDAPVRADDGIFPPAPAARTFVDFDGRGFLVRGKRTFIASGSLHYPRVPRALWRDRLLRFKRAGFNTVETYAFWNLHEQKEGRFDFSGERDLDAFLKTARSVGLYAIVRVGPYVCAEWDSGGYPVWLRFKPGVRVREPNAEFEKYVGRWYDRVMPIVAANQIHRGGNVILVQLENEHPRGWGREMPNDYFRFLRDRALARGLQVPWFFSGLHHGSDPAGARSWDSKGRVNPWLTTEFWPGWYDQYGPLSARDFRRFDRGTWKILAFGGNGYNYYMLHGGTNFDYWNNNEDASSYDYGAAIGQAGALRPIYYRFKRAALFARSFESVLENSENADADYKDAATAADLRVTARRSPAGTIVFLDNNGREPVKTQFRGGNGALFPDGGPMTIPSGVIAPIILNYALVPDVRLDLCTARVLGIATQGDVTTLVIYGTPGESVEIHLSGKDATGRAVVLGVKPNIPAGAVASSVFPIGKRTVRVLAMSEEQADRTWFVEVDGGTTVVSGPEYVGDVRQRNGRLEIVAEHSERGGATSALGFFGAAPAYAIQGTPPRPAPQPPALSGWQMRRADDAAQPRFNDARWKTGEAPPQMGADGDISAYAWYRATVRVPSAGRYTLALGSVRDRMIPFVDGKPVPAESVGPAGLTLDLAAGEHVVAVFAAHHGRDKLFNHLGPLDTVDVKGLTGPAALQQTAGEGVVLTGWRVRNSDESTPPASDAPGWSDYRIGEDAFGNRRGVAWFQTTLPAASGVTGRRTLHFASVDEKATVFLNGKQLHRHEGWNIPFDVALDASGRADGPNVLSVRIENESGTGGIDKPVTLATLTYQSAVTGWKLRGGPGNPNGGSWQTAAATGVPTFYRAEFTASLPGADGPHPIWRVSLAGLSAGSVWLNGHNLGRYPEKVPVDGIYLPECWLRSGRNALVVFDEEGKAPSSVRLIREQAASRIVTVLTSGETP